MFLYREPSARPACMTAYAEGKAEKTKGLGCKQPIEKTLAKKKADAFRDKGKKQICLERGFKKKGRGNR